MSEGWILVTGASSGLGREIARQYAARGGVSLILTARRRDRLETLAAELAPLARCHVIAADLSRESEVERLLTESLAVGPVIAAVLNAGVTYFGEQRHLSGERFRQMLETNVTAVVTMTQGLLAEWNATRAHGRILIVSSVAGLLPVPYQAAYAGTKAFVTQFALSLQEELRHTSTSVAVFCPGGIDTEMNHASGLAESFGNTPLVQSVESCAREAIALLESDRALQVAGWLNRVQVMMTRAVPRRWVTSIAGAAYRRALKRREGR